MECLCNGGQGCVCVTEHVFHLQFNTNAAQLIMEKKHVNGVSSKKTKTRALSYINF